jgi:hypothetical protein
MITPDAPRGSVVSDEKSWERMRQTRSRAINVPLGTVPSGQSRYLTVKDIDRSDCLTALD